jgi:hypothetical protein
MEAGFIEKDVMFLMIDLQQLARLFRTLSCEILDEELWLLRSFEMNLGSRSHILSYALTSKTSSSIYSSS